MSATGEIVAPAKSSLDRVRLVLASVSAVSILVFGFLGYRVLLIFPFGLSLYLLLTGLIGCDITIQSRFGRSTRVGAAFLGLWSVAAFILRFLYGSSSESPSDLFLLLVPAILLFTAIIYRYPFVSPKPWKRHMVALGISLLVSALWLFSLALVSL